MLLQKGPSVPPKKTVPETRRCRQASGGGVSRMGYVHPVMIAYWEDKISAVPRMHRRKKNKTKSPFPYYSHSPCAIHFPRSPHMHISDWPLNLPPPPPPPPPPSPRLTEFNLNHLSVLVSLLPALHRFFILFMFIHALYAFDPIAGPRDSPRNPGSIRIFRAHPCPPLPRPIWD